MFHKMNHGESSHCAGAATCVNVVTRNVPLEKIMEFWSFASFNDTWSQCGHSVWFQFRYQPSSNMGSQHSDCNSQMATLSAEGICVGMYVLTCSPYYPGGQWNCWLKVHSYKKIPLENWVCYRKWKTSFGYNFNERSLGNLLFAVITK